MSLTRARPDRDKAFDAYGRKSQAQNGSFIIGPEKRASIQLSLASRSPSASSPMLVSTIADAGNVHWPGMAN
jgi:hypothetical protein